MKTRDELKKDYKNAPPPMGVFLVHNTRSHFFVLGSSRNLEGSLNRYRFMLQMGKPGDPFLKYPALMTDYKAQGEADFEFRILDSLKPKTEPDWNPSADLAELEKLWMDELKSRGWKHYE